MRWRCPFSVPMKEDVPSFTKTDEGKAVPDDKEYACIMDK